MPAIITRLALPELNLIVADDTCLTVQGGNDVAGKSIWWMLMRGHQLGRFSVVRQLAIGNPKMQRARFFCRNAATNNARLSVRSFWEETEGSRFAAALFLCCFLVLQNLHNIVARLALFHLTAVK